MQRLYLFPTNLYGFCGLFALTYNSAMTKQELIKLAGSQSALAKLLGVSKPAVCQWKDQIPELRLRQLKDLRPEWFTQEKT